MADAQGNGNTGLWRPRALQGRGPEDLVLISIDDVMMANPHRYDPDNDIATLVIGAWPKVKNGRFDWAATDDTTISITTTVTELHRFLNANGLSRTADNPVQRGDNYAAQIAVEPAGEAFYDSIENFFQGPVFDCTREFADFGFGLG